VTIDNHDSVTPYVARSYRSAKACAESGRIFGIFENKSRAEECLEARMYRPKLLMMMERRNRHLKYRVDSNFGGQ
jgi:hypothetical protein